MPSDDRIMISSVLSNSEELEINNAYANIRLIAGKIWAYDQEDPYRKLNQSLWIKYCKLCESKNGATRTVRDVIPTSRLAQYGDYEYNEDREKMYKAVDIAEGNSWLDKRDVDDFRCNKTGVTTTEPWMLKKVEEYLIGLTSANDSKYFASSMTMDQNSYTDINGTDTRIKTRQREEKYSMPIPYTIDDNDESQLQSRISSNKVKDLWNFRSFYTNRGGEKMKIFNEAKSMNFRHSNIDTKLIETRKYNPQSTSMRNDQSFVVRDPTIYSEANIRKPVFPILSAEVPEFFPKAPTHAIESRSTPIPFFPSSNERSYQDELFPYNRGHFSSPSITIPQNAPSVPIAVSHPAAVNTLIRAPHQWIQRLGPPIQIQVPGICSGLHPPIYSAIQPIYPAAIIHRPINLHDKILTSGPSSSIAAGPVPIPVYQRPAEMYQEAGQRRVKNHQGVDFNNLILLTKNAMKARRNQSKNPQQASSFILESRQPNLKSETDVLQWLDKGYPKRAREFVSVNSLVSELNNFKNKCNESTTTSCSDIAMSSINTEPDNLEYSVNDDLDVPVAKKRLYRDVLANTSATTEIILETVLDKRYDELEQQAMEQYRTSEECLALRYQELERQALEQYKNGSSSTESIRSIKSSTTCGKKDQDDDKRGDKVNRFGDNDGIRKCSGFEKLTGGGSSQDNVLTERVKGSTVERQVVILRPDNRFASAVSAAVRETTVENNAIASSRGGTTIITKSLTALNHHVTIAGITGKKIKGASGDNKEDRVKSSLKERHVILVSAPALKQSIPLSSEALNMVGSSVSSSLVRRYRKPITAEVISSGGAGDEKLTVMDSPGAQVWLSSLWS